MYSSESLERWKNYLLAVIYMQRKNQGKSSVIEGKIEQKLHTEMPKAVHSKDTEKVDSLVEATAAELHISADKSQKILHNNFLPVLHLMEYARKKVNDRQTLLRYLNVVSHVNGTDLIKISEELGKKGQYLNDLVLSQTYENMRDVLVKLVNEFGVSVQPMADAISRSQIRAEHKTKAKAKSEANTKAVRKDVIQMDFSDEFKKRFSTLKKKKYIPDDFTGLIKRFLHNLHYRRYIATKGATKAYVHIIEFDINSLVDMNTVEAEKYLRKVYPDKKPKRLMFEPKAYANERRYMAKQLKNVNNVHDKFTLSKDRIRITLDNDTYLNVYVYAFNWERPTKDMDAIVCLLCYINPKMTVKKRRLLKRFNSSKSHYV